MIFLQKLNNEKFNTTYLNELIGMLLGILIWIQWPSTGTYVLGIFIGIKLIFDGIAFILTATAARKQQKL